jgi:peptidoglycan/xylan/chitin deacetylase (PgdA/CDA1 family)
MVHFSFAFNFSIEQTYVPAEAQVTLAEQAYVPLLDVLERHPRQKASFFIDGKTALFLADRFDDLVRRIRRGVERGQFEIGTYTYAHPILSLIPLEDCLKQLKKGQEIDQATWGVSPKGLLLPEGGWDPSLPFLAEKLGLEWLIIPHLTIVRDYPDADPDDFHRPCRLKGLFGSQTIGLCTVYEVGDRKRLMEVMVEDESREASKGMLGAIEELARKSSEEFVYVAKEDAEFIYHSGKRLETQKRGKRGRRNVIGEPLIEGVKGQIERFHRFLTQLEAIEGVKPTLLEDYLRGRSPVKEYSLRPAFGWYKSFQEWLGGSEKVGSMIDEARLEIKVAEYAVLLAEKVGLETSRARETIGEAWERLMSAEISVGRRACAHPLGEVSRVILSMEDAVAAKETARKAIVEGLQPRDPGKER